MTIASLAAYKTAYKNTLLITKNAAAFGPQFVYWMSHQMCGGSPATTAVIANTANGIKPSSPATGYPTIPVFTGACYITGAEFTIRETQFPDPIRWMLADVLWYAGPYTTTSNVTLSAQPSYSSRIPGGTDYTGLQIWSEGVSAGTSGPHTATVTYTNDAGATGKSTGSVEFNPPASSNVGIQAVKWPLAAGDRGVQKIETVVGPGGAGYSFNLMVLRELLHGETQYIGGRRQRRWVESLTMPQIYSDSCLILFSMTDDPNAVSNTPNVELALEVAAG